MQANLPIAEGEGGLIWAVIIIIFVISQFIKAATRGKKRGDEGTADGSDGGYSVPEDELQAFLRSITREQEKPQQPPPLRPVVHPPPPLPVQEHAHVHRPAVTAAQVRQTPAAVTASQQHQARQAPPVVAAARQQPRITPAVSVFAVPEAAPAFHVPPEHTVVSRRGLVTQLRNRESLRDAIVLREILGPSLALRRQGGGQAGYGAV